MRSRVILIKTTEFSEFLGDLNEERKTEAHELTLPLIDLNKQGFSIEVAYLSTGDRATIVIRDRNKQNVEAYIELLEGPSEVL